MAREPGTDLVKVNTEITALKEELRTIAHSSNFSGENWLGANRLPMMPSAAWSDLSRAPAMAVWTSQT